MRYLDTSKLKRNDITQSVCREIIENTYRKDYLLECPTFYIAQMTYQPYSWLAHLKSNRDYLIETGDTKEDDFIEFRYTPVEKQLELF